MFDILLKKLARKKDLVASGYYWRTVYELIAANFKTQDSNFVLGSLWSLIGPAGMLAVLYFIFRSRFGQGITAYPLYLLIGIVIVNHFVTGTTQMVKIFFSYRELALNSMVPRESFLLSQILMTMYGFLVELSLCFLLSLIYGFQSWKMLPLLLPLSLAYMGVIFGVSFFLSVLYCFSKDIEHLWIFISRLFFFVTPIFYSLRDVSQWSGSLIYYLNPLTPFLISFRELLMGSTSVFPYMHSLLLGILFFIPGYCILVLFENVMVEKV